MALASLDSLAEVRRSFALPEPEGWTQLRRSAVKRDAMIRVTFGTAMPPVLVRFHDPAYYRRSDILQQTKLRAHLSACGVPVPRLHPANDGGLFMIAPAQGEDWAVTVEDWVEGEAPQSVTLDLIAEMGHTLAAMHNAAPSSGARFGHGTGMSLFTEDDQYARNASRVRAAADRLGAGSAGLAAVFDPWDRARDRLAAMWPSLPGGPVHADFAEYNLLLDQAGSIAAVIDFNLAGDDVYVNELVHACVRLPSPGEDERDRENWLAFIDAYESVRPLRDDERLAIPYLVTAIRPFRPREVSSLLKASETGDAEAVARGLRRLARLAEARNLAAV